MWQFECAGEEGEGEGDAAVDPTSIVSAQEIVCVAAAGRSVALAFYKE
jgi:hypothetical protein